MHDLQEPLAGDRILARRALQRLDETDQGSKRRPQLVTGVGDEIDPYAIGAALLRQIVQDERDKRAAAVGAIEPGEPGAKPALGRDSLGELDALGSAALGHAIEGGDEVGG